MSVVPKCGDMVKQTIKLFCLITFLPAASLHAPKPNIVFIDPDVLLEHDTSAAIPLLSDGSLLWGTLEMAWYGVDALVHGSNPLDLKKEFLGMLAAVPPPAASLQNTEESPLDLRFCGNSMPPIIAQWMKTSNSSNLIKEAVTVHIKGDTALVSDPTKQDTFLKLADITFSPAKAVQVVTLCTAAVGLIDYCAEHNISMCLFGNINDQVHEAVSVKHFKTFNKFNRSIISGQTGSLKPSADMYDRARKVDSFDPNKHCFIEKEPAYVAAAETHKLKAVLFDTVVDDWSSFFDD